jgi:predicted nuclease of predicted toxin-antitoxin system
VKLLLDENLSRHLIRHLSDCFPAVHVSDVGLESATDEAVWDYAKQHSHVIVSKDSDFHQRSFLYGAPPKVIWINTGNQSTNQIASLVRNNVAAIRDFAKQRESTFLILGKKA